MNTLFWSSVLLFTVVPIPVLCSVRRHSTRAAWYLITIGCLLQTVLGLWSLVLKSAVPIVTIPGVPPFGAWTFAIDSLGGLILLLLGVIGIAASLYASEAAKTKTLGTGPIIVSIVALQYVFTSFLAVATHAIPLLIAWEGMSLSAYGYILSNHKHLRVRRAAFVTLAVSELGFLALVLAFIAAAPSSGLLTFQALHNTLLNQPVLVRETVFGLALFGFGVKCGILPMQMWMPQAYHVTPPHLNAILAGGLLNLGLFGIIRIYELIGTLPSGWGVFLILIGALAVFLGALYAVIEKQMNMILAYSSIENVGFMLIGLGLAISFQTTGAPLFAGIAMSAMFIQMVSHALAKSLCFLTVGEIHRRTGITNIDGLGGLFKRMPGVAVGLLIGCLTLAAVAPFSGFTAEWLTLQSMLQVYRTLPGLQQLLIVVAGALAATGAAMALTAFLRLFAFTFTGRARSHLPLRLEELQKLRTSLGYGILAVFSASFGFFPTSFLGALQHVVNFLVPNGNQFSQLVPDIMGDPSSNSTLVNLGGRLFSFLPMHGAVIQPGAGVSSIAPTYLLWWFIVFGGIAYLLKKVIGRKPYHNRVVREWTGGSLYDASSQYTASAYANPHRMLWKAILLFRLKRTIVKGNTSVPLEISVHTSTKPWLHHSIYSRIMTRLRKPVGYIVHIQHGYLWGYITVMLLAILSLLIWANLI